MDSAPKYIDAMVIWDDRNSGFGIALVRDDGSEDEKADWLRPVFMLESRSSPVDVQMKRLHDAAFIGATKDMAYLPVQTKRVLLPREVAAKRVAKAVKKELKAIEAGKEPPSSMAMQLAIAMLPRKARR